MTKIVTFLGADYAELELRILAGLDKCIGHPNQLRPLVSHNYSLQCQQYAYAEMSRNRSIIKPTGQPGNDAAKASVIKNHPGFGDHSKRRRR